MTTYVPTDFNTELTSTNDDKLSDLTIEDFDILISNESETDDSHDEVVRSSYAISNFLFYFYFLKQIILIL